MCLSQDDGITFWEILLIFGFYTVNEACAQDGLLDIIFNSFAYIAHRRVDGVVDLLIGFVPGGPKYRNSVKYET